MDFSFPTVSSRRHARPPGSTWNLGQVRHRRSAISASLGSRGLTRPPCRAPVASAGGYEARRETYPRTCAGCNTSHADTPGDAIAVRQKRPPTPYPTVDRRDLAGSILVIGSCLPVGDSRPNLQRFPTITHPPAPPTRLPLRHLLPIPSTEISRFHSLFLPFLRPLPLLSYPFLPAPLSLGLR